jgi:predicted RNA-binding Zn-ribbon protein involved in translation (DUF1610 family)
MRSRANVPIVSASNMMVESHDPRTNRRHARQRMREMIAKEQWEAKGRELFGGDQERWKFVCPQCGHELSTRDVREQHAQDLPALRDGDFRVEQECIGRHLKGVGCDWAAYGLFRGPVIVDGTPVFDFAGKPFTRTKAA